MEGRKDGWKEGRTDSLIITVIWVEHRVMDHSDNDIEISIPPFMGYSLRLAARVCFICIIPHS